MVCGRVKIQQVKYYTAVRDIKEHQFTENAELTIARVIRPQCKSVRQLRSNFFVNHSSLNDPQISRGFKFRKKQLHVQNKLIHLKLRALCWTHIESCVSEKSGLHQLL